MPLPPYFPECPLLFRSGRGELRTRDLGSRWHALQTPICFLQLAPRVVQVALSPEVYQCVRMFDVAPLTLTGVHRNLLQGTAIVQTTRPSVDMILATAVPARVRARLTLPAAKMATNASTRTLRVWTMMMLPRTWSRTAVPSGTWVGNRL